MADYIKLDTRGIRETQKALYAFSDKLGDRVTQTALRSGANYMLKHARQQAPKNTGRLRRAIKVKNSRIKTRRKNGIVSVYLKINAGKNRADTRGAYYGNWVDQGHRFKNGRKVTGKKFMERAYNADKQQAARLIVQNIEYAGQQLARKLK